MKVLPNLKKVSLPLFLGLSIAFPSFATSTNNDVLETSCGIDYNAPWGSLFESAPNENIIHFCEKRRLFIQFDIDEYDLQKLTDTLADNANQSGRWITGFSGVALKGFLNVILTVDRTSVTQFQQLDDPSSDLILIGFVEEQQTPPDPFPLPNEPEVIDGTSTIVLGRYSKNPKEFFQLTQTDAAIKAKKFNVKVTENDQDNSEIVKFSVKGKDGFNLSSKIEFPQLPDDFVCDAQNPANNGPQCTVTGGSGVWFLNTGSPSPDGTAVADRLLPLRFAGGTQLSLVAMPQTLTAEANGANPVREGYFGFLRKRYAINDPAEIANRVIKLEGISDTDAQSCDYDGDLNDDGLPTVLTLKVQGVCLRVLSVDALSSLHDSEGVFRQEVPVGIVKNCAFKKDKLKKKIKHLRHTCYGYHCSKKIHRLKDKLHKIKQQCSKDDGSDSSSS